jgi:hypothetical protein
VQKFLVYVLKCAVIRFNQHFIMKTIRTLLLLTAGLVGTLSGRAQTDSTATDDFDFENFGDADDRKIRTFATQKVLYLSPTRLISVGYEAQGPFDLQFTPSSGALPSTDLFQYRASSFRGLRLGVNTPVISRSNFILNLGLTYWNTDVRGTERQFGVYNPISRGLRTTGINATAFKPFDNTHYLILQANVDLSGDYRGLGDLDSRMLTYSGTAIYGWKPNDNLMWGLGLTRTYRAGQVLHIPVLYYNRTFNPRWGVEAILPARAGIRRNFGTQSLLMLGYELEGNTFFLGDSGLPLYLRRGELKPRLSYERKLTGFVWLAAQVGWRYNWRFNIHQTQNPGGGDNTPFLEGRLGNPLYVNISLNLVSP